MRACDVVQRLLARRDPDKDSYAKIAVTLGYKSPATITNLFTRDDVYVSTLYKLCKYFGYVIVVMKPDDPSGKSDMVINMKHNPMPLMDENGNVVRGRPRKRKIARPTKRDMYKYGRERVKKPVVLNNCKVKKESKAG